MEKKGIKTVRSERGQAWETIWSELRQVGVPLVSVPMPKPRPVASLL